MPRDLSAPNPHHIHASKVKMRGGRQPDTPTSRLYTQFSLVDQLCAAPAGSPEAAKVIGRLLEWIRG